MPELERSPLVLIVDDQKSNRLLISTILKDSYRLVQAADGVEALQIAHEEDQPDLILLDLVMPRLNGDEVLRQLRADPQTRGIAIIVLTSDTTLESERLCLELGADDFLTKPFNAHSLRLRTRNLIQRRQLQRDLAESQAEALRLSEERQRLATEGVLEGLWEWNLETGAVYFSQAWKAVLGLDETFTPSLEAWHARVHPDDLAKLKEAAAGYLTGRSDKLDVECRMQHQAGHWVIVRTRASLPRAADGQLIPPRRLVGLQTDITADKTSAEVIRRDLENQVRQRTIELEASRQRLARAQGIAHLGNWRQDLGSSEQTWSDETYHIFGIPVGTPIHEAMLWQQVHPDDRDDAQKAWHLALSGQPLDIEFRLSCGDLLKWVRCQAELLYNPAGRPIVAEGTIQDITDSKQVQAVLQGALMEAQRMAKVKSEFLANMSHEIRTPLNAILGLAQIGQRENAGRSSQRLFDQMYQSGRLLLGIVNDILDFSKIEAGKLQIEFVDVELASVLQHVRVMCSDRASEKGFLLRIEAAPDLPAGFKGDPLRISQILVNLVGNAIKFTEKGEVVVNVLRDATHLLFRVSDTGIGMAPSYLANLFTPFEQADGSITRRFGGTGLGLAITKRLVGLMGGEIRAESQQGVGSVFEVRLPLVEAVPAPPSTSLVAQAAPENLGGNAGALAGIRILAAEDNPVNRMVLEDMVKMEGAVFSCGENGQEALDILLETGESNWDIILTDIHMPVMGGHDFARAVAEWAPALPVVGVTAHAMPEERQRCLESGMRAHLPKPIVLEDLVTIIQRFARPRSHPAGMRSDPPGAASEACAAAPAPKTAVAAEPLASARSEATASSSAPLLDWTALQAQYPGRIDFVHKMLAKLVESQAETPSKLREGMAAQDWDAVAFVAHSFAGAAGALKAEGLRHQAKHTEALARNRAPEAAESGEALARTVSDFIAEVRAHLARA